MESVAGWLTAFRNSQLTFDRLQIGNRTFTPGDLRNTRIVRVCTDADRIPSYFQTEVTATQGLFSWSGARRTAYGIKKKPASMKTVSVAATASRHLPPGDNKSQDHKARRIMPLDELCVTFMAPSDSAVELLMTAHRLRGIHAQFDSETNLPFPLHELRLLESAVTS
jgi:hypothetical protein